MKHAKDFFGVLFSVLVCVFLVGLGVWAATTIGDKVQVNGSSASTELSVIGTASISQDLWASGSFQFGAGEGTGSLSYSRLGSGTTGHSLLDADDLLITGLLEVDDNAFFDGNVSLSDSGILYTTDIRGVRDTNLYLRIGDEALTSHSLNADDDLLVTGDLEVDGTTYFDGNVSLSDSGILYTTDIIGIRDTNLYLKIGDEANASHSLNANDDLLVTGEIEVDGTAFFDGVVSVSDANGLRMGGGVRLFGGTASPQGSASNPSCVQGDWYFKSGAAVSSSLYFCTVADSWDLVF